jgi:hypothetical protein
MASYVKAVDFASKDALLSGDPAKIIKGTEIDTEFNNIATAVSTKLDTNSPTLTGTPTAPTAVAGTNTTQIATTAFVTTAVTNERTAAATLTNKTITSPVINEIIHEGTADDFETTVVFTDPTVDQTITIPDDTGTVALTKQLPTNAVLYEGTGTYSIAGTTTLTVTVTGHNLDPNDVVYLNFTSGDAVDGNYTIQTVPDDDTFTITHGTSITTSGNVSVYFGNKGLVEFASAVETSLGLSNTKAVTPAGVVDLITARTVLETEKATTSGTSIDFTGIPSWVRRITVMFRAVSHTGSTGRLLLRLGDAGGIETTGYTSGSFTGGGTSTSTTGFVFRQTDSSSDSMSGHFVLTKISGNTWIGSHSCLAGVNDSGISGGGFKQLSDTLTQIQLTTESGIGTFDNGAINILYE